MNAKQKKQALNDGKRLPDPQKAFWQGLTDGQKRDLAMLPILLHEALRQVVEDFGGDVAPDLLHFLNVSASRAVRFHSSPLALTKILLADCARMLKATGMDEAHQAALAVAYLVLMLADEGKIPNAGEAQVVLSSLALLEEAKLDGPMTGWRMDQNKVAHGAKSLRERLESQGYLINHHL